MKSALKCLLLSLACMVSVTSLADMTTGLSTGAVGFSQAQSNSNNESVEPCDTPETGVYTPILGKVVFPAFASLSNVDVRIWYLEQEGRIPSLINKKACTLEQQARQAWSLRNSFRTAARYAMLDQSEATTLNKTRANLTWSETVSKYSSTTCQDDCVWTTIIEAAQRSNQEVNKALGVTPPGK
ncbi:hypothetical protein [Pseudomonas entomophila]|uniref:DUF1311 domain-containing protein n=1 Tax=Pseudomonas entomophila TaxID=312306 RepID=A0ABY9QJK9_9PSED|nr:hypothetical protein [Pseudomonas entomophila]WMW03904.1 hypothetical protein RAH46_16360 [Pseudomonas entomophila]